MLHVFLIVKWFCHIIVLCVIVKPLFNVKYKIKHVVIIPISVPITGKNDATVTLPLATGQKAKLVKFINSHNLSPTRTFFLLYIFLQWRNPVFS